LPAADKVRRDAALVADRNRGLTWPQVASRHGVSETQARNIHRAWRDGNQRVLASQEPMEWLWRTLERYESIQAQLAVIAASADNSAAQVGALRAQMDAIAAQTQLLVASGLLPRNLRAFREAGDMSRLIVRFVEILERHEVEPELVGELLELVQQQC
jgi:hypothetical protein